MTPIFVDYDEVEAAFHLSGGKIRTLLSLFTFFWWSIIGHLDLLWQARVKGHKVEFATLFNVEDIEEEEAELDSSIANPPDEPWPADSLLL